ncbi:MAG: FHA domain-containing protein [Dactylosporangium sp.]|nr:FHA domain-containing protein [Dactylosporangium sp.]NNJ61421.1 FHA domain-containing protein [Dactylosporangium sp.]
MKSIKMTVIRESGVDTAVDLNVTVDEGVTVGDLAAAIAGRDPTGRPPLSASLPEFTLAIESAGADGRDGIRPLPTGAPVDRSGIHSGTVVRSVPASTCYPDHGADREIAVVEIRQGPDAGLRFPLRPGSTSVVGRDPSCHIVLSDPLVSKFHARINVTDVVEIVDTNSSNGVQVGGGPVSRARLRSEDTALLGDTVIAVTTHGLLAPGTEAQGARAQVAVNRSPRLDPVHAGTERAAPEPPTRPQGRRFPLITALAPLLMGGVLYLVSHSLFVLVFVALAPLLTIGTFVEETTAGRRSYRTALAEFRQALAVFNAELHAAAGVERAARQAEHPGSGEILAAAQRLTPLVWTRRPEHGSFLDLRLGLGSAPSRDTVEVPRQRGVAPAVMAELNDLIRPYATIARVPVVCRLTETGALGVAGHGGAALPAAWSLIAQLVTLHSPAEVVLAAVMSAASARRWDWLRWLPHASPQPQSPLTTTQLTAGGAASIDLIGEIDALIARRSAASGHGDAPGTPLPAVVLLVEDDAEAERQRLVDLAERGPAAGVHVIWVASAVERLPAACRTFVEVTPDRDTGCAGFVRTGAAVDPVEIDTITADQAEALARRLAPTIDAGARVHADVDLPRSVSFLALAETPVDASAEAVIDRWRESGSLHAGPFAAPPDPRREVAMRALVGATGPAEAFHLDLAVHGPHALVGGTTGAGKSELLQSWILGMACAYSPQRVTFLFVDYKGGSAFGACQDLPHAVGLVTDLDQHLVHRALISLRAELTYREQMLNRYAVKELTDLERARPAVAPPRLVIVVDEFAALKKEIPEFVDGVVDIAQRGRSLGLHLILATQRPAGVITENLRANTNLRVALRMADEADSNDVLGSPIAAGFDLTLPGRAVAKTGPGRLVTFQTAYVGGWTTGGPPKPKIRVETLAFGPGQLWPEPAEPTSAHADAGDNDIRRIVTTLERAAGRAAVDPPRQPWLPELPRRVDLATILGERPDPRWIDQEAGPRIGIGRRDLPGDQAQPPAYFYPDRDGNLVVYGTGGTGKSTLLCTIALAAATGAADPCHVYGVEFGTRGLTALEPLPQVGSIIRGDDDERVGRLLDQVRQMIDERATRFSRHRATTLGEYRRLTGTADPRILVLLDGVGAFAQQYQPGGLAGGYEKLLGIATDGRPVGVHLLVSADRPGAVPSSLASALQCRVVLRLAADQDYGALNLRSDVLPSDACAGRGLLGGEEVQIAVYGGTDGGAQHEAIRALATRPPDGSPAPAIGALPDRIALTDLPGEIDGQPVIGLDRATLTPVALQTTGSFLLTGPSASGRTTGIKTLARALLRWRPAARLYYFGADRAAEAASLDGWTRVARGADEIPTAVDDLLAELADGEPRGASPLARDRVPVVAVVEGLPEFGYGSPADLALQKVVKAMSAAGHLVIGEGEINAVSKGSPLHELFKVGRTGMILQPQQHQGLVFQVDLPRGTRQADFPQGRGAYVSRGRPAVVQLAISE